MLLIDKVWGGFAAVHVDRAGIDICLVGDSVGMVVHGHDTTLPVTMEDMLLHCKAVARGADRPLLVGDLPFGSYEQSTQQVCTRYKFRNDLHLGYSLSFCGLGNQNLSSGKRLCIRCSKVTLTERPGLG
jgi:hypothetical protein